MDHAVVAIITARGGSKSLPRKNILPLNGLPLLAYSILAAQKCPYIKKCYLSTEDSEIKKVGLQFGAEIIDRPLPLASDQALSSDVVAHALLSRPTLPPYFVLLQPTSPLRNHIHLTKAIEQFFSTQSNSCVSVASCEHHPYKTLMIDDIQKTIIPLRDKKDLETPRQELPLFYRVNGAIYIGNSQLFLEQKSFFTSPCTVFVMSKDESIDIDSLDDFKQSESILQNK